MYAQRPKDIRFYLLRYASSPEIHRYDPNGDELSFKIPYDPIRPRSNEGLVFINGKGVVFQMILSGASPDVDHWVFRFEWDVEQADHELIALNEV